MPGRIRLEIFGETVIDRTLERVAENASDARPAWDALEERFEAAEKRQFASSGAYGGTPWPPLSSAYASWKARHFPGQPILRATDDLYLSLTTRGGSAIRVKEPGYMILGSAVPYGPYHQAGDGVPRRPPVALSEYEKRTWVKVLQRFLVTGVARRNP